MATIDCSKDCRISWSKLTLLLFVLFLQSGLIDAQGMADDTCDRLRNQTTSSVTVRQGEKLFLTCLSDATQNEPQLTWFKNEISSALDSERDKNGNCSAASLMITDVGEADGGKYVCRSGVSEKESGTICVTVEVFPQTLQEPECFTNPTGGNTVMLTCIAERGACPAGMVGSLLWNDLESMTNKIQQDQSSNGSHLINSQAITIQQALGSEVNCILSCEGNADMSDCSSTTLLSTCEVDIFTALPKSQTIRQGENATFTCQVLWDGYNVAWLISNYNNTLNNKINSTPSDNDNTSTLMLFMFPEGKYTFVCSLRKTDMIQTPVILTVTLTVTPQSDIGTTKPTTIWNISHTSASIYVQSMGENGNISQPFSMTYIVIIIVVVIVIFLLVLFVVGCVVYRRKQHSKIPSIANIHARAGHDFDFTRGEIPEETGRNENEYVVEDLPRSYAYNPSQGVSEVNATDETSHGYDHNEHGMLTNGHHKNDPDAADVDNRPRADVVAGGPKDGLVDNELYIASNETD